MKKILSTLLAASMMLLGAQAFAQVSVNAGYLNSTLATSNTSTGANGAYAGVTFNLPIAGNFGIAPGLYYSLLTSKETANFSTLISGSGTFTEHAINVPVYLNYGFPLAQDMKILVYAGPTFQYGLASTIKYDANVLGISGSTTVNNYDDDDFNRMNIYLGGGIGFEVSRILISVGYDYGMMNQYKDDDYPSCHRSNLKLGLGFIF